MDIKNYIKYLPETGQLIWIKKPNNSIVLYTFIGTTRKDGYISICFKKRKYFAHRVAWYLYYGEWPKGQIDHINGIRNDNKISNLRDVTQSQNQLNQKRHREKTVRYYYFIKKSNKYRVQKYINGKLKHYGIFDTEKEAIDFIVFNIELFPGFKI